MIGSRFWKGQDCGWAWIQHLDWLRHYRRPRLWSKTCFTCDKQKDQTTANEPWDTSTILFPSNTRVRSWDVALLWFACETDDALMAIIPIETEIPTWRILSLDSEQTPEEALNFRLDMTTISLCPEGLIS